MLNSIGNHVIIIIIPVKQPKYGLFIYIQIYDKIKIIYPYVKRQIRNSKIRAIS